MKDFLEVRACRFGRGLFAKNDIEPGTFICSIPFTTVLNFEDTMQLKEKESHALQVDDDRYVLCEPPLVYSNHSCEPNCGINATYEMFTLSSVRKGQELLWDYSTSMLERHWTMRCACGARSCRGLIQDFDLLPPDLQKKYLRLNIVFPFIPELIRAAEIKTA
jgi:hypothetical protein